MDRAPPPELADVLAHLQWRPAKLPTGERKTDLGLDKKSVKAQFKRAALLDCGGFLMNAPDAWLQETFKGRLDETWHTAMGPDDELEKLRYLSYRVAAELMRATGVGT